MDIERIKELCVQRHIRWSAHVAQRMMERSISRADVITAICSGEIIEDYPDDFPLHSCLILGIVNKNPIHVVVAQDEEEIVIVRIGIGFDVPGCRTAVCRTEYPADQ